MSFVRIYEVGPRDGLQNEPGVISVADRLTYIDLLRKAGLRQIEVGSFVSPRWVPQMAASDELLAALPEIEGQYDVLVPNMRGWESFDEAKRPKNTGIAVFVSATEGFSQANLNCSIAESLERLKPVVDAAMQANVPMRGYVSCVTDCPFDGPTDPNQVAKIVADLRALAEMPISLGETIGKGTPEQVDAMLAAVTQVAPQESLAGHFHDTSGLALKNVEVALGHGLRAFDASAGGLGGCPYAPGAPGNVATEAVVALLHKAGYDTGIDETKLAKAAEFGKGLKGRNAVSTD